MKPVLYRRFQFSKSPPFHYVIFVIWGKRGCAELTAATTTSAASVQSTKTGRSFEATPLVKGMSASQISPGCGIVVKTLVLRGVAVQEGAVITHRRPGCCRY